MKRILLPVDGSANALNAARYLVREFFGNPDVEVHLLNVRAPLSSYVTRYVSQETIDSWHRDEAEKALKPCRELFDKHGLPFSRHVEKGRRAEAIVAAAKRLRCERIVMTTSRKNSLTRLFEPSVTDQVLELTQLPVEVIVGNDISPMERYVIPAGLGTGIAALVMLALD